MKACQLSVLLKFDCEAGFLLLGNQQKQEKRSNQDIHQIHKTEVKS
jgi:hypothetical protein